MVSGKVIIKEIEYSQLLERIVMKNNASSGKINVPREYIGKKVYVIIPEEEK